MGGQSVRVTVIALVALGASLTACNRSQNRASSAPTASAGTTTSPQQTQSSPPGQNAPNPTTAQSGTPVAASVVQNATTTQTKLIASDHVETLTVAQQSFRLLTHVEKIEGGSDETVEWWELRNSKDRVIYHGSFPVEIENGSFANTLAISASDFNTAQGGGILIHGFELPSAPGDGGWVQVFGFKYGREKFGVDDSLFSAFGPPVSVVEGEFLDVGTNSVGPTPVSFGGATVTVMHDVLRFRLWTGNFSIVYPVLINWITGQLQPASRCPEITSKGRIDRCSYPVTVEAADRDQGQPTFVRLFPEPDDGFKPEHVVVRSGSKVEFLEARCPVTWNQDDQAISFSVRGDNWLKVRIDGVEGWIHEQEDFDAVGLPESG